MASFYDFRKTSFQKLNKRKIMLCSLFVLAMFAGSTFLAIPGASAQSSSGTQPIFSTPVNLSNDGRQATNPDVWNVGTNVYVAWSEQTTGLMFRESPDGGVTWYPPLSQHALNLAPAGKTTAPLLSANGSNVYVVWSETTSSGVAQIFEATSVNYGLNFTAAVQVSSGSAAALTPVIASWGNNVYVAWTSGSSSIVSCSANAGSQGSWTRPYVYSGQHEPQLYAWGGQYVYAVSDGGMVISSNNCQYWQGVRLYNWGSEPWVWGSGQNVYLAWETKGASSAVYYAYSNNYGRSFSGFNQLAPTLSDTWAPMLWAYGNSAWIAFHSNPGGSLSRVYVFTTTNAGASWAGPTVLSPPPKAGQTTSFPFTVVSSDGQNVFVAWSQEIQSGYWQLSVSYSGDGGQTWLLPPGIDASQNPPGTEASNNNDLADAAIASYGTSCYAVWQQTSGTSNQVYFSYSTMGVYAPPASITAKPIRGAVGAMVTLNGSDFLPSTTVSVEFDGTLVASTTSNSLGNFTVTFAVPASTAGTHVITATDGKNSVNSNFKLLPSVSEKPVTGNPGAQVTLSGNGFGASSSVNVYFDGQSVGSTSTNSSGSFSLAYIVPNLSSGKYTVQAIDSSGDNSTATFTVK